MLSAPSKLALGVVALCDEAGRGVADTLKDDEDAWTGAALFFCGRCASGNKGSGVFFILLKRNMDDVGVFLGVVFGLDNTALSTELASDLDDSDWRYAGVLREVPFDVVDARDSSGGDCGSSIVAVEGRPRTSLNDFLVCFWLLGRVVCSPSRGISFDRRNLAAARLIRDLTFRGPFISFVGAVVMIAGANFIRLASGKLQGAGVGWIVST